MHDCLCNHACVLHDSTCQLKHCSLNRRRIGQVLIWHFELPPLLVAVSWNWFPSSLLGDQFPFLPTKPCVPLFSELCHRTERQFEFVAEASWSSEIDNSGVCLRRGTICRKFGVSCFASDCEPCFAELAFHADIAVFFSLLPVSHRRRHSRDLTNVSSSV